MINTVIFSKDRGCQLELLLRSMKEFYPEHVPSGVTIICKWTTPKYEAGYVKTFRTHPGYHYVTEQERDFRRWVVDTVDATKKYTVFFVDDNVFKEPFSYSDPEFKRFEEDDEIACLTLRMHPRINYCYTEKRPTPAPTVWQGAGLWRWKDVGLLGDWSYTMSVDGHIFRTSDILPYVQGCSYQNPNTMEGSWWRTPIQKPFMQCYQRSRVMNIPFNRVQDANGNHAGDVSAEYLNEQYLAGKKISLNPIRGLDNVSAHQEIPLTMEP